MSVASSCLLLTPASSSSSSPPRPPRPPCHPCRPCRPRRPRPTATRDPQCSLPDLNHDHPRPVFPAGPQPRPSTPSVPCRTSTTTIHAQCSLPDLNWAWMVVVEVRQGTCRKIKCQIECQKICQVECQKICQKICQIDMPEDIP